MDLLYQTGQHNSTNQLYKSGQKLVIAVVISIAYVNEFD